MDGTWTPHPYFANLTCRNMPKISRLMGAQYSAPHMTWPTAAWNEIAGVEYYIYFSFCDATLQQVTGLMTWEHTGKFVLRCRQLDSWLPPMSNSHHILYLVIKGWEFLEHFCWNKYLTAVDVWKAALCRSMAVHHKIVDNLKNYNNWCQHLSDTLSEPLSFHYWWIKISIFKN